MSEREWLAFNAHNLVMVTLMAIVGVTLAKVALTKYPVPGLSKLVLAA